MGYLFILLKVQVETGASEVIILIFLCLLFFFISAVCAGGEHAFSHLNEKDVNALKSKNNNNSRNVSLILERPGLLFVTLLITRVICNLLLIFILNALLDILFQAAPVSALSVFVKIIIVFFLLVLFSETLPRAYAHQKKLRMAFFATPLASSLISILEPLSMGLIDISNWLSTNVFKKQNELLSIKDIDQAFALSSNDREEIEEKNILRGLVNFEDIIVRQIMKARMDIRGIQEEASFKELIALFDELRFSRIPVYQGDLDNITGIVHAKDLVDHLGKEDFDWKTIMRKPVFVHEHKPVKVLLKEFQEKHLQFAIIVDEFGGTSGIVTMLDIMEEIVGDIRDEFDSGDLPYAQISDNEFIFEGKITLNELERTLNLPSGFFDEVKGESNSLGGLLLELSGKFPDTDNSIIYRGVELTPLEIEKLRITKVKVVFL